MGKSSKIMGFPSLCLIAKGIPIFLKFGELGKPMPGDGTLW
jgi:hypothetical protein